MDGLQTSWYENGNKEFVFNYKDGKSDGLATRWDESGQKIAERNFKNGVIVNKNEHKSTEVVQEIKNRCQKQMGEYGAAMVKSCVDQDLDALPAISSYLDSHKSIVTRCLKTMQEYGYVMVKSCAEQDIKAEDELKKY